MRQSVRASAMSALLRSIEELRQRRDRLLRVRDELRTQLNKSEAEVEAISIEVANLEAAHAELLDDALRAPPGGSKV